MPSRVMSCCGFCRGDHAIPAVHMCRMPQEMLKSVFFHLEHVPGTIVDASVRQGCTTGGAICAEGAAAAPCAAVMPSSPSERSLAHRVSIKAIASSSAVMVCVPTVIAQEARLRHTATDCCCNNLCDTNGVHQGRGSAATAARCLSLPQVQMQFSAGQHAPACYHSRLLQDERQPLKVQDSEGSPFESLPIAQHNHFASWRNVAQFAACTTGAPLFAGGAVTACYCAQAFAVPLGCSVAA